MTLTSFPNRTKNTYTWRDRSNVKLLQITSKDVYNRVQFRFQIDGAIMSEIFMKRSPVSKHRRNETINQQCLKFEVYNSAAFCSPYSKSWPQRKLILRYFGSTTKPLSLNKFSNFTSKTFRHVRGAADSDIATGILL